jgi:hypothetical protein
VNLYLASRYERNEEMRLVRDRLIALGHSVCSRWIDPPEEELPVTAEELNDSPASLTHRALKDLEDLKSADIIASFTGGGGRGGRHVEFGIGLALGKTCVVVGPREHVFHTLPDVICFPAEGPLFEWLEQGEAENSSSATSKGVR